MHYEPMGQFQYSLHIIVQFEPKLNTNIHFPPSSLPIPQTTDSPPGVDIIANIVQVLPNSSPNYSDIVPNHDMYCTINL